MLYYLKFILIFVIIATISCQKAEKLKLQNACALKTKCSECIQTPTCAWCFQPDFGGNRCYQPSYSHQLANGCSEEYTWNPDNELRVLVQKQLTKASSKMSSGASGGSFESEEFSSTSGSFSQSKSSSHSSSGHGEVVQISPQHLNLKLRIREEYTLNVYYSQAEDYPVDLYYLMDLSKSMEDDKDKLSLLGDLLAETMRNITSNFRLGFGSFVDKVVMPYVSTNPKNLIEPCTGCAAPYGFKNVMTLSQDTSRFAGEVRNAAVSGNLDGPEGGFDAIMQAIVCREEIGWREKARRLLVFSTDAGFHYAGDGKLGGIVKPNDGKCHLDRRTGYYTHSSLQDYPSVPQINLKVKENAINVIFAVTREQISVYNSLKTYIEGASSGVLSNDSSNVVDLVREEYSKISSAVEIKDNSSSYVKITYHSKCLGDNWEDTSKCNELKVGDVVTFEMSIEVLECPKDPRDWKQTIQVYPVGINESLIIDLEMLCDCPCERPGNAGYIEVAPQCNYVGTLKCGVCECDSMHFGRGCECNATTVVSNRDSTEGCRPDNTTQVLCSGRGNCVCGQCECEPRPNLEEVISGQYCECDNFSCDRYRGLLCSGLSHGTCVCGRCECAPEWGGLACDCRLSNDTCIPPTGGKVCSGHGVCECGACKCNDGEEGYYGGKYCETCPTCPDKCHEYKECVQCQMYKTGSYDEEKCANCSFVPKSEKVIEADEKKGEILCTYYDEDNCRYAYVYTYDDHGNVIVRAQEKRECPPIVFVLGIVLGVIAAIVLMGLAMLLVWKAVTTIHDRREFAKFEKERMMAKWDTGENPIYKQATSTFKNPTYAGK